jgi:hypothetical protein
MARRFKIEKLEKCIGSNPDATPTNVSGVYLDPKRQEVILVYDKVNALVISDDEDFLTVF